MLKRYQLVPGEDILVCLQAWPLQWAIGHILCLIMLQISLPACQSVCLPACPSLHLSLCLIIGLLSLTCQKFDFQMQDQITQSYICTF